MPTSDTHRHISGCTPSPDSNVAANHRSQQQQSQRVVATLLECGRHAVEFVRGVVKKLPGIYTLLIFTPLGLLAGAFGWNPVLVFTSNILAIIPLSSAVSAASDKLADRLGFLVGTLINATFGNIVELSVGILAINREQIGVAQSTMLGSVLSDILLVLGVCLIAAAGRSRVLKFNPNVVNTLSSLMIIATVVLILPTALYSTYAKTSPAKIELLSFSRATACILLFVYTAYFYFQFWTHSDVFMQPNDVPEPEGAVESQGQTIPEPQSSTESGSCNGQDADRPEMQEVVIAAAVLIISVMAIIVCTRFFFDNLEATAEFLHTTTTFIALIIIPLASNAPEASTIIVASRKEQMDYAIGVIVGSILQIALFVLPILVITGWAIGRRMTLYFEVSQTCILFLSVLTVNSLIRDGKYTYLHGVMLLSMYAVVILVLLQSGK